MDAVCASFGPHSVGEPVFSLLTSPQSVVCARQTRLVDLSIRYFSTHSIARLSRAITLWPLMSFFSQSRSPDIDQ